jgi:hypothetical protein
MAVTEVNGKKFIQISMDASGGDWVMSREAVIRELRLTGIAEGDYMTFYEAAGGNPRVCRLDYYKPATMFQGRLMTKLGFNWNECSVANPAAAILSIELE